LSSPPSCPSQSPYTAFDDVDVLEDKEALFFDFEKDVRFVNAGTTEKVSLINEFKGIENETYQDRPGCLLANAVSIGSGMDLTPADVIIMGDIDWIVQAMQQVGGRIRRAKMTQKAKFTEVYRLLCFHDQIRIQWWMNQRVISHDSIRNELARGGKGKAAAERSDEEV
jgi:hypothetical protein